MPRSLPAPPSPRRIVVLGATGRTGALVAGELVGQPGVLLLGRREQPLAELAAEQGHAHRRVDLEDLHTALHPGDVLLSCVGPYDVHGDVVVRAAIIMGATYLDVSGEPAFLRRVFGVHHEAAMRSRVTLLPALGYSCLPGHLVAETALAEAGPRARRVEVGYFADGGLGAGSAGGRASLVGALSRPTTTFSGGRHHTESVGVRRGRFVAAGRVRSSTSLGGAEIWTLPDRHQRLRSVDVHTGWFGPASAAVGPLARLGRLGAALGADRLAARAVEALGDGPEEALTTGTSRFVARVADRDGHHLARSEAVGGNPIVLAARLVSTSAIRLAEADVRDLPPGASDPATVFGVGGLRHVAGWAGLVTL